MKKQTLFKKPLRSMAANAAKTISVFSVAWAISNAGCMKEGKAVFAETGEPFPNAQVSLYSTYYYPLWGMVPLEHESQTGKDGRFRIVWWFGLFDHVTASAPGYYANDDRKLGGFSTIKLTRIPDNPLRMRVGVLVHDGKAAEKGFDLLNEKKVKPDVADLIIRPGTSANKIVLEAPAKGGLFPFVPRDPTNSVAEFRQVLEAPLEGYLKSVELAPKQRLFFVRSSDGRHYARVYLEPVEHATTLPGGGLFVGFFYYVQPDGSRLLPPEAPGF